MARKIRTVTFPRMSFYSDLIKEFVENLGANVMMSPPITSRTIKLGVRHSSTMMCYPFKITLGSFLETLEEARREGVKLTYMGVGTSLANDGSCRFQQYFEIQKKIAEDLGYEFDTLFIEKKGISPFSIFLGVLWTFKNINTENSYFKLIRELLLIHKKMKTKEREFASFDWNDDEKLRIGIVGEFYNCIEPSINYHVIDKLRSMGVNVHTFINYSNELCRKWKEEVPSKYVKEAKKFYDGYFRAHGDSSFYAMYFYKAHNFDAVMHMTPLTCMPQTTADMIMQLASKKLGIPLYTFPFDEETFQTGFDMRLDSIINILHRRKGGSI